MWYSWEVPESQSAFGEPKVTRLEGHKTPPVVSYWFNTDEGKTYTQTGGMCLAEPAWDPVTSMFKKYDIQKCEYMYCKDRHGMYRTLQEIRRDKSNLRVVGELLGPDGKKISDITETTDDGDDIVTTTDVQAAARLSIVDKVKEAKFDKIKEQLDTLKVKTIFRSSVIRCMWNSEDKIYITFRYKGASEGWHREDSKLCPEDVPYTDLDINSRHMFSHQGKKKNKRIYYKGFRGNMLAPQVFNGLMMNGCLVCNRKPTWGNQVVFVNKDDFFCEHCARDEEQVVKFRMMEKTG